MAGPDETAEEVASEYGLRIEDVLAALRYASRLVAREEILPLHAKESGYQKE